ncbi:MAG: type VI secretion system protein TssA [Candidatus Rokuibacteriota bacterium]
MLDVGTVLAETRELPPCGPNLEHDLSFFELEEAARGKPEQRTGDAVKPAEDPNWAKVMDRAQAMLHRSKDLRVAVHLTRALASTEGLPGLATGLSLIHGLLERYWDGIHPLLEADRDNDPTERLNALAPLIDPEVVIKDLRDTYLVNTREQGQIRARDVEVALGRIPARAADASTVKPLGQLQASIGVAFSSDRSVPSAVREAHDHALAIQALITERVGASRTLDLAPLAQPLRSLLEVCDAALGIKSEVEKGAQAESGDGARPAVAGEIRSRDDAVQVLELVCHYLERHEPSNPAPLFIRRAQRLIKKNFLEIVRDLMPDSLSQLEKLAGDVEKT